LKRLLVTAGLAAACLVSAVAGASAGTGTPDNAVQLIQIGRMRFPDRGYLVDLPQGRLLHRSDVKVGENGRPVRRFSIAPLEAAPQTFATILMLDASNSMHGRPFQSALDAARTFAAQKNPSEEVGILAFNGASQMLSAPTPAPKALRRALARPPALRGGTHIYDAVDRALTILDRGEISAGAVVLLSDGSDTGSVHSIDEVIARARAAHVRIFTVGLVSGTFDPGSLKAIADQTGGSFHRARSASDLQVIYAGLGTRLANQYVLQYRSKVKPKTPVEVAVRIDGVGTASVHYTAPTPATIEPFRRSFLERFWMSGASVLLMALLAAALTAYTVVALLRRPRRTLVRRIGSFVSLPQRTEEEKLHRLLSERLLAETERSFSKTRWWGRLETTLEVAGITIPPEQIVVGTTVATLLLAFVLVLISPILVVFALAVPMLVNSAVKRKVKKVRDAFQEQLPDNLQVLASALRAGHSFVGALAVVVQDAPEPSRGELQRVVADEQLGVPMEDSLREVGKRMENIDLEQVALLAELQRDAGGSMAEVLETVIESIRSRFDLQRLVKTLTAQGRMARWLLTLLPVFLAAIITFLNPGYMRPLFLSSGGRIAIVLATAMVVAGSLAIKRIVDIKV
jgi:tight adherence protein B